MEFVYVKRWIQVLESYDLNLKPICHDRDLAPAGPIMDVVPYQAVTLFPQEASSNFDSSGGPQVSPQ